MASFLPVSRFCAVGAFVYGVALGLVDGFAVGGLVRQTVHGDPVAGRGALVHGAVGGGLAVLVFRGCGEVGGPGGGVVEALAEGSGVAHELREVRGPRPGEGERGLGDERQVVLVQRAGHGADVLGDVAGVVDFLDLDRVLQVQRGARTHDQRNGLRVGGELAVALGLLVLGHQRCPVLELDAEEVRAFLEFVHADAVGEEALEVAADRAGVAGVRGRGLLQRGQEVTGRAEQRAFGDGVDGDDGLGHLRSHGQGDGEVEEVVLGAAGRGGELDAGLAVRALDADVLAAGNLLFDELCLAERAFGRGLEEGLIGVAVGADGAGGEPVFLRRVAQDRFRGRPFARVRGGRVPGGAREARVEAQVVGGVQARRLKVLGDARDQADRRGHRGAGELADRVQLFEADAALAGGDVRLHEAAVILRLGLDQDVVEPPGVLVHGPAQRRLGLTLDED